MKYSEAEKQIKTLSSEYEIDMSDGDFSIVYNGIIVPIRVDKWKQYKFDVYDVKKFSKLPFSNKLYIILAELAMTPLDERVEKKKHYIKIFDGGFGYLNIDISTGKMKTDNVREFYDFKTKFTDKEIEQLKQRDDIPLDWNKVTFEEVED